MHLSDGHAGQEECGRVGTAEDEPALGRAVFWILHARSPPA